MTNSKNLECKYIEGYEGLYTIDIEGNIFGIKRGRYINASYVHEYPCVILSKKNQKITLRVHRLVASTFLLNDNNYPHVHHIDNNILNFKLKNLKWVSIKENMQFKAKAKAKGENANNSILTNKDVLEIYFCKESTKKISEHFNIDPSNVYLIKNKKTWKHILDQFDLIKIINNKGYLEYDNKIIIFQILHEKDLFDNRKILSNENLFESKIIKNYPNYSVDIMGNIFNIRTNRKLKLATNRDGYLKVTISKIIDGIKYLKTFRVHRLVADAFIPNNNLIKNVVNHKNEIKSDNRLENLEWCTPRENSLFSAKKGLLNKNSRIKDEKTIIDIFLSTDTIKNIAKQYDLGKTTITKIKKGIRYIDTLKKYNLI